MKKMRLIVLLACLLSGTSGVPISQNADLMESATLGEKPAQGRPARQSSPTGSEVLIQAQRVPQQFQPQSPRIPAAPQPQLPALTNPWASQHNPNLGLSQLPAHFQYLPYPNPQQPQYFYYPIVGPQSRSPTFSYGVPVFQNAPSQQYPANARPLRSQQNLHQQNAHQMHPNQPQQQQVHPFLYMVPQMPQRMAGPYGGLSSEELQNMGRMNRVNMQMPAFRGNVFPVSGHQPVVPVNPLRPAGTFHTNTFPGTGMTYPSTAEIQPPPVVPNGDSNPAAGGSHTNNGALPHRIPSMQDRERVPCDHILSAESPATNSETLAHGPFISAVMPTVQPDPNFSDPNQDPTTLPTPEYKEALIPASAPRLFDTVNTNPDMYP